MTMPCPAALHHLQIWLAPEEVTRIAKHLNLSTQRFLDTHCKQVDAGMSGSKPVLALPVFRRWHKGG